MDTKTKRMIARNLRLLDEEITHLKRRAQEHAKKTLYRMAGVAYIDAADLMAVADAVRDEDFDAARRLLSDLETEPRERVPSDLYQWLVHKS